MWWGFSKGYVRLDHCAFGEKLCQTTSRVIQKKGSLGLRTFGEGKDGVSQ